MPDVFNSSAELDTPVDSYELPMGTVDGELNRPCFPIERITSTSPLSSGPTLLYVFWYNTGPTPACSALESESQYGIEERMVPTFASALRS